MNKKDIITVFAIFCIVTILSICWIWLLVKPAFISSLNLTQATNANIGNTIAGIVGPIISLVSVCLLYLTLTRQNESIKDQRSKNECDIIFMLMNQLEKEIEMFYASRVENKGENSREIKYSGSEGLDKYVHYHFVQSSGMTQSFIDRGFTFSRTFEAKQIMLFVRSYMTTQNRIRWSDLDVKMEVSLGGKLHAYYNCRLRYAIKWLCITFENYPDFCDDTAIEIYAFGKSMGYENAEGRTFPHLNYLNE